MLLPCLIDKYEVAQLRYLVCCCNDEYNAKCRERELNQLDVPLQSTLVDKITKILHSDKLSQWTMVLLNIWFKECKNLKLIEIFGCRDFKPAELNSEI